MDLLLAFLKTDDGQRLAIILYSIVATLVLLAFPGGLLAYLFGIPLMFFIPGFAVVRLFFWKGTSPEAKFVLSMGISVLVVIILGLFLVLTPIGLGSNSSRASLIVFALAAVGLETFWLRADRGAPSPKATKKPAPPMKIDKVVAAMLATALVVSGISLGLIVTAEYPSRTYFALTDANGRVITNTTYMYGTNQTFVLHMKNGEDGPRNFTVSVYGLNSFGIATQTFSKVLKKNEVWNQTVVLNMTQAGYLRIDFDLYIGEDDSAPYLYGNLHLWVTVVVPQPET
jgi:uncharacterized membrane protein